MSQAPHHTTGPPTGPQEIVGLITSMCSLKVSCEFKITPRYLTNIERRKGVPKRRGSKNPGSFLHVNATSPVLSGLTDNLSMSHHISTV